MVQALPNVTLRDWKQKDEPLLTAWFEHAEVPQYLVPRIRGINLQQQAKMAWLPDDEQSRLLAVCAPDYRDAPVGICSVQQSGGDSVEIGLIIGEPSIWGSGYGRAATIALVREVFRDRRCGRVAARVQQDNTRALSCFRAIGFEGGARHGDDAPVWLVLTRTAWAVRYTAPDASPA